MVGLARDVLHERVVELEQDMIGRIRKDIEDCIGKRIIIRANKGRKKIVKKRGVIESVYPSLFVVRIEGSEDSDRKVSYTYSDVLTKTVEIMVLAKQEAIETI